MYAVLLATHSKENVPNLNALNEAEGRYARERSSDCTASGCHDEHSVCVFNNEFMYFKESQLEEGFLLKIVWCEHLSHLLTRACTLMLS